MELELGYAEDKIEKMILKKGMSVRVFPGMPHRFKSLTPTAKILEVSTQHFDEDSYRIEDAREVA